MWMFENYIGPPRKDQWLLAAEKLRHVNTHVQQDIEDYILMIGFKGKSPVEAGKIIDDDLNYRRKLRRARDKDDEDMDKVEDLKRNFIN